MLKGHIYVITNLINGKQYVGQTSRNIDTRYYEHCYDNRSTSAIHAAIVKYGVKNFKVEELEEVDITEMDSKEQYWIAKLNTFKNGYNKNIGGNQSCSNYRSIQIVENGFLFDSCEYLGRELARVTDWSEKYLIDKIRSVVDTEKTFLGYHIKYVSSYKEELTDILDLENWAKSLNIQYQGKRIYCKELDKEFDTTGEAAKFLLENNYYCGVSKMPIQTIITLIGQHIKSGTPCESISNFTFYSAPGSTKNLGQIEPFKKKKVYCKELDLTFESGMDAAKYFIDNKIWTGIKLKTAKLRVSDVVRGVFPNYKGYTFISE